MKMSLTYLRGLEVKQLDVEDCQVVNKIADSSSGVTEEERDNNKYNNDKRQKNN